MKTIDLQLVTKPDVTVIPNSIIDQHLLEANELQLKIYLYILRNTNQTAHIDISIMADYFNETEKDITRAISFWQKRGVLSTQQNEQKPSTSDIPKLPTENKPDLSASDIAVSPPTITDVPSAVSHFQQNISKDKFSALTKSPDFSELRFVAETYMGKPLNSSDLHNLLFIKENLGFSNELIDYLLQHCAECNKKSFHYVQKVACEWANKGITTAEEAQSHCSMYNKRIYTVMKALGKKTEPTDAELNFIERWYQQYGFEADVILEACNRTVLATDRNRFAYADKILSSWHKSGIHHLSDISRADASYQTQKKQSVFSKVPTYVAKNPFLQHQTSNVDYDALEKELLQS